MSVQTVLPEEANAMRECLVLLGKRTLFVEDSSDDLYEGLAREYYLTQGQRSPEQAHINSLSSFLRWMAFGDRLHAKDAPFGWDGVAFYYSDYGDSDAGREQCAAEMVTDFLKESGGVER